VHDLKTVALEPFDQRHSDSGIVFNNQYAHTSMVTCRHRSRGRGTTDCRGL
jgi:hypothetical protein